MMSVYLSPNFTLAELTRTDTGLPNEPHADSRFALLMLATYILQPIRDEVGPLKITSGYRGLHVNRHVGGNRNSQHLMGQAADFQPLDRDIDLVYDWIVTASNIKFGQMILETRGDDWWIHASLPRFDRQNQEALTYENGVYKPYRGL